VLIKSLVCIAASFERTVTDNVIARRNLVASMMFRNGLTMLMVVIFICDASAAVDWVSIYPSFYEHNSTTCEYPGERDEESLLQLLVDGDQSGLDVMALLQLQTGLTLVYKRDDAEATVADERGTTRMIFVR
jgi:hypothetical protein